MREAVAAQLSKMPHARLTAVVVALGITVATWYYKPRKRKLVARESKVAPLSTAAEKQVLTIADANPWWGYKRIAVLCRRSKVEVSDRQVYRVFRDHKLFQRRKPPKDPKLAQAAKLSELLPSGPNELWQMDVTYIHLPGAGWWYAVTVIDYYSRYLLALRFTASYAAGEVIAALKSAREKAEGIHGPLAKEPFLVTDNGTSFLAKRFKRHVADNYAHVRIQYRTPTQLGLLERFHATLKQEEVYWRICDGPAHARDCLAEFHERYNTKRPHWALVPVEGGDPVTPEDVYVHGQVTRLPRWKGWARAAKKKLDRLIEQDQELKVS